MSRNRPPRSVREQTKGNGSPGPQSGDPSDDRQKPTGHNREIVKR